MVLILLIFYSFFNTSECIKNEPEKEMIQELTCAVICDTTKVIFYNKEISDTLFGWGVVRIEVESKKCPITIEDMEVILLRIKPNSSKDDKYLLNYYASEDLVSEGNEEILNHYKENVTSEIKRRGLCCIYDKGELEYNRFDFGISFLILPE